MECGRLRQKLKMSEYTPSIYRIMPSYSVPTVNVLNS